MYIIYNAWAQKQLSKVPFHMMDNLAEIKIIFKKTNEKLSMQTMTSQDKIRPTCQHRI